jgi:hypothetical protein
LTHSSLDPVEQKELVARFRSILNEALVETDTEGFEMVSPTPQEHFGVLGESLTSYLAKQLDPRTFDALNNKINGMTTYWLHTFLKYKTETEFLSHFSRLPRNVRCCFRQSKQRARLLLGKMALVRAFPSHPTEGFLAYGNSIPLVLASYPWPWLDDVRVDLGLPSDCVRVYQGTIL